MANNNPVNSDVYGFEKLTVPELRKVVTDSVKQIKALQDQKKEYVAATNEVIKEENKKIDSALSAMNTAEQVYHDQALELAGNTFLADAATALSTPTN